MPVGFEALNSSSNFLIDGTNANLTFLQKGSGYNTVEFYSPSYPLVFIRCTLGCLFWVEPLGGGMYRYHCNGAFDYWVFCRARHSNDAGLQIFNEVGDIVYTSDVDPLSLVGYFSYTRGPYPPPHMSSYGFYWPTPYDRAHFGMSGGSPVASVRGFDNYRHAYCPNLPAVRRCISREPGNHRGLTIWNTLEAMHLVPGGFDILDRQYPGDPGLYSSEDDGHNHGVTAYFQEWSTGPGGVLVADVSSF